jgi:hypothetical protein
MKLTTGRLAAINLLLGAAIGCNAPSISNTSQSSATSTPASTEDAKEEEKPIVAGAPGEALPEDEVPVTDIPRKFTAHDPIQGRRSRRAAAGGNSLGIGTTAAAGFYAKFQSMIQAIDYANELYWPQHDFSYPKTQEEYMKEVVKPALNGIPLPDLPEDEEYCYVPSQPKQGLQIRLKPGSPRSKVPAGTSPEDAIKMLAGQQQPGEQPAGEQPAAAPTEQPSEEPSPDIRTRAEQVNGAATGGNTPGLSEEAKKHAIAPGGLAPAGGIE